MRLAAIILVAALLSGCASAPQGPREALANSSITGVTVPTIALASNASVDAPVWSVGDAWVVETRDGDQTAEATLVVVSADGGYVMATTDERTATYDAAFDVSYLGKIRASDLAGAQQDQPIRFFDFPLAEGKAWSTTWDGIQVNLTATFSPKIATPAGPQPGFAIVGAGPDGKDYVRYDFVPALGWWSHLEFTAGYGFVVKKAVHGWTGEYLEGAAKTLLTLATAAPVGATPAGTFTVDKDQSTVLLTLIGSSSKAYARGLALVDPGHQPYNPEGMDNVEMQPSAAGMFKTAFLPPTAGEWQIGAPMLHDPDGFFHLTVQQIALAKKTL